jgi:hypothetical protein
MDDFTRILAEFTAGAACLCPRHAEEVGLYIPVDPKDCSVCRISRMTTA